MLHCATAANTSIKQLTNPRAQSVLPLNVAAKCIIGLLFFFLVFYFYLLYRFLPYRAHRCTAKPSLQAGSMPRCTTSVGAFCCPTLFPCSPLHCNLSPLHSRIFIEIVVILCLLPACLPACLVFVIFEVCLDSLDAFCQQGVIYIFFCLVFALHFLFCLRFFLLLLIKYLCLLLVCAPTEFSFLSCQGVPSIVCAQRFSGLSSIWFSRFVFHVEHVPHLRLTKWKLTQLQVLKTVSCPLHTDRLVTYFKWSKVSLIKEALKICLHFSFR